ncbi:MAG TPA: trypsin-like peptidase domain-containing protein [Candidatus Egerieimonas intestinavium]|uniref:Trypsin-like peptidase domain-containing protein n=1 Tax=Candidatus Egerieimonas intestinavium TaxID=2840777 RepID=A0A9D1JEN1_9FIRM|nr:trypsin-like peptidase domain-containing protein [Candidatus Egerieimonas intestinavium]
MDEEKKNSPAGDNGQENPEEESYHFIREMIKPKPLDKKKIGIRIGQLAGGGAIFGLAAAVVFALVAPSLSSQEEPDKVDIQVPTETPTPTPEAEATPTPQAQIQQELGVEEYKEMNHQLRQVAQEAQKSLVTVKGITSITDWFDTYESQRQVSGVIIAENGGELYILTEYRGVEQVDRIQVVFYDESMVDARYLKDDPQTGLAILKVPVSSLASQTRELIQVATLGNSNTILQGEPVLALGSPMGYGNSLSFGNITSVNNRYTVVDHEYGLLATDILGTSEGSGVLLNLEGEIVGIIKQISSEEGEQATVTGLPVTQLSDLLETLTNNGDLLYVGIRGQEVTETISEKTGMPVGVYVESVETDSPAMAAGIQPGDVLTKLGGETIRSPRQYQERLKKYKAGQKMSVTGMRKGNEGYVEIVFDVTVGVL